MAAAFDAAWDGALDEAILIAQTVEHEGGSAADVVAALRQFREEK